MWRSVEQTASHSKRQRVCTGSVFSRGCHHQLICKTCHRFTHGTATVNPAEECVSQISARLPKCLKTVFSPFFSEEHIGGKRWLRLLPSSPFFPRFLPAFPFGYDGRGDEFVLKWLSLINGAFVWSNLTLPGMDRLCCFCINRKEKCLKK